MQSITADGAKHQTKTTLKNSTLRCHQRLSRSLGVDEIAAFMDFALANTGQASSGNGPILVHDAAGFSCVRAGPLFEVFSGGWVDSWCGVGGVVLARRGSSCSNFSRVQAGTAAKCGFCDPSKKPCLRALLGLQQYFTKHDQPDSWVAMRCVCPHSFSFCRWCQRITD